MGLVIEQMDVETAFLNGNLASEVYVKEPEGYDDGTGRVCTLHKALYGLRESPRAWYECLDEFLRSLGFVRRKNYKDIQDAEVQKLKIDILNIEKQLKLKQLAVV